MDNKFNKMKLAAGILGLFIIPLLTYADGITDLISAATDLVTDVLIPLAFGLCILYFFWGIAKYIREGASSEKAAEEGKRVMLYGIIGIFVVFSVWGIIEFIQSETGIMPVEQTDIGN